MTKLRSTTKKKNGWAQVKTVPSDDNAQQKSASHNIAKSDRSPDSNKQGSNVQYSNLDDLQYHSTLSNDCEDIVEYKDTVAIEVKNVFKSFRSYQDKATSFKERFVKPSRGKHEDIMVLKDISFRVRKGEAIGIIGKNGCGKSTTLKLLTRILYPNEGTITMKGRVSSLIELGAGFHPDMTGRENIYTNASIFGLKKKEIDQRLDDIIHFSELEEFIDTPVRTYSSGMYMRLAFAVAINVDADILLIDEILAVGDSAFQKKCFEKLQEIKANGTTIVIVSHSMDQMYRICDRLIWIEDGKIREEGIPKFVGEAYLAAMEGKRLSRKEWEETNKQASLKQNSFGPALESSGDNQGNNEITASDVNKNHLNAKKTTTQSTEESTTTTPDTISNQEIKWDALPAFCEKTAHWVGNRRVILTNAYVSDLTGAKIDTVKAGLPFQVVYQYETDTPGKALNFVISFTRDDGVYCFGTGSVTGNNEAQAFLSESSSTVCVKFEKNNLLEGNYLIDIGIQGVDGEVFHYIYSALRLRITCEEHTTVGIVNMPRIWEGQGKKIFQEYC